MNSSYYSFADLGNNEYALKDSNVKYVYSSNPVTNEWQYTVVGYVSSPDANTFNLYIPRKDFNINEMIIGNNSYRDPDYISTIDVWNVLYYTMDINGQYTFFLNYFNTANNRNETIQIDPNNIRFDSNTGCMIFTNNSVDYYTNITQSMISAIQSGTFDISQYPVSTYYIRKRAAFQYSQDEIDKEWMTDAATIIEEDGEYCSISLSLPRGSYKVTDKTGNSQYNHEFMVYYENEQTPDNWFDQDKAYMSLSSDNLISHIKLVSFDIGVADALNTLSIKLDADDLGYCNDVYYIEFSNDANFVTVKNNSNVGGMTTMALTPYPFIDNVGVRKLAETLFKATNTRAKERILTSSSYAADSANATHVLSAQALYAILGNLAAYATDDGTAATFLSKIKALDLKIGTDTDTAEDDTVYGAIAAIGNRISALTHLTYQVVTGDIETEVPMADAADDVLYLQHDEPSYSVGQNGLLLDSNGDVVEGGEEGSEYAIYFDPGQDKYFKATKSGTSYTVTNIEVFDEDDAGNSITADPAFEDVALVEDTSYNLYVCNITEEGDVRTAIEWIRVGDTAISLSNYLTKSDYDVSAIRDRMFVQMTDTQVVNEVQTAFNATDPYAGDSSYLNAWLPTYYTVSFNANGGTGTMANQTFVSGQAQALDSNTFTRTGYDFNGWNTADDGTGATYANTASYTASANATLYAQWTENVGG